MCSPGRAGQRTSKFMKIHKCLDLIGDTMVLIMSTWKFDAKNTTEAFKHVPDLFRTAFQLKSKENHLNKKQFLHMGIVQCETGSQQTNSDSRRFIQAAAPF